MEEGVQGVMRRVSTHICQRGATGAGVAVDEADEISFERGS